MTKLEIEKLKQNPKRYKHYLKKCREYGKKKRLRERPERLQERLLKKKKRLESRRKSIYWQTKGYKRYQRRNFRVLANHTNCRCKKGKITALDLWSIAKKQKLICPMTGEKLTRKNISVDHITPISKGGDNSVSNIQLVTHKANTIKNDMNLTEFFEFCQAIIKRLAPMVGK